MDAYGALAQGTLYTQPHCMVLPQFEQGTLLVPDYFNATVATIGYPPQPEAIRLEI